jgi:hypothetical protein
MVQIHDLAALQDALTRLLDIGVIPQATPWLETGVRKTGLALRSAIKAEVSAYSTSGNPELLPELDAHGGAHIAEICRLFSGEPVGDFSFVRAHAQRRAEQHFPLEAILHAYRCGHKILSGWMRDAVVAACGSDGRIVPSVADFTIEYTNTVSTILTAEYVTHVRMLAEAEGDRRTELLNTLLSGFDESDGRVERLLRRAGYLDQRQSFCVVLVQSADPGEMENPERAQRVVDAVIQTVSASRVRTLIGIRQNVVTAVISETRRLSGWTAPQAKLAGRLHSCLALLGPAVLTGISSDQPSTAFIPKALQEASMALDCASVSERVVQFSALPIRRLLLHRAADHVQTALPSWMPAFIAADARLQGALIQTLRAYADSGMNILRAARTLKVHPNTIYARFEKILALTGVDSQRYHELEELLLAIDCRRK